MGIELRQRVAVITGGANGIGRATALVFAEAGASVAIWDMVEQAGQELVAEIAEQGGTAAFFKVNVTAPADVEAATEATLARFGRIDILINNAGISMRALLKDVSTDTIRKVMDINFYGTVYCTRYALPSVIERKGTIVGVSSIAGYRGLPGRSGYSASKFAMQGFLEAVKTELLGDGVHVMWVCPGFTTSNIRNAALNKDAQSHGDTPMDESKMMSAEECSQHILKAIRKKKRTLVLTFTGKRTVFMNKFFPKLADKFAYKFFFKNGELVK